MAVIATFMRSMSFDGHADYADNVDAVKGFTMKPEYTKSLTTKPKFMKH